MLLPVSDPVCSPVGPTSTALGMGLPHGNWLALVVLPWAVSKRQFNFFFLICSLKIPPWLCCRWAVVSPKAETGM